MDVFHDVSADSFVECARPGIYNIRARICLDLSTVDRITFIISVLFLLSGFLFT